MSKFHVGDRVKVLVDVSELRQEKGCTGLVGQIEDSISYCIVLDNGCTHWYYDEELELINTEISDLDKALRRITILEGRIEELDKSKLGIWAYKVIEELETKVSKLE